MRKLASVRTVNKVTHIENSDNLDLCFIDGWQCISKRNEFSVGDKGVYFEVDSFLPVQVRFEFLRKNCLRVMQGAEGFRLKTMKLRGQLSQGLLMPLSVLTEDERSKLSGADNEDITELLGVKLYEVINPMTTMAKHAGSFPYFIVKTDQERIQNLQLSEVLAKDYFYEITEKLDGTSCTMFYQAQHPEDNSFGVCSRNLEVQNDGDNLYSKIAALYRVEEALHRIYMQTNMELALQGEIIGPGIQGNKYKLRNPEFRLFDIYNITERRYLSPNERNELLHKSLNSYGIRSVPILDFNNIETITGGENSIDKLLSYADGQSKVAPSAIREGIVFKAVSMERFSFKAISNAFLLKEKD